MGESVDQQVFSYLSKPSIDIYGDLEKDIGEWTLKPLLDIGVNEDKLRKVLNNETNPKDPLSVRLQQKNKNGEIIEGAPITAGSIKAYYDR